MIMFYTLLVQLCVCVSHTSKQEDDNFGIFVYQSNINIELKGFHDNKNILGAIKAVIKNKNSKKKLCVSNTCDP